MKIDMRVLMFVTNPFISDPRVYNEAISLLKAGHKVTVIAWDIEKKNPPKQNWDGIEVIRPRTRQLLKRHRLPLLATFNLLLWQWQAYRQALKLNKKTPFSIIHCHDLDTLAIGTRLKRKLKIPLIYDAHEMYGYMVARNSPRWIANIYLCLEKRLIRKVDRIINVCEPQRRYFQSITDKQIMTVMNCKPLQSLEYESPDNEGAFTILYIGTLGRVQPLSMLVRAVKELSGVRCLIGGIGQPAYVQSLKEECSRTSNITFLGRVTFDKVIPMTMQADAVFCMFDPRYLNNIMGMPNKLFEAMICGRPIICTKGTYSGEITEQEEIGLAVEYSKQALKEAIIKLRDHVELRERLSRNALKAAITKYNWEKEEEKLIELYQSLRSDITQAEVK